MATLLDNFTRADGALGSMPSGLAWQAVTGTWTISGNKAVSSTAGTSNPIAAVDVGLTDVDVTAKANNTRGDALYVRVTDANNWLRVRTEYYSYTYQYYQTEYLYNDYKYMDVYQPRILRREVQYKVFPAWADVAWVDTGTTWACRSTAPATRGPDYNACGVEIHRYQNVVYGAACSPTTNKRYKEQMKDRNPTWNYKWTTDGNYSLACDESYTTQTMYQDTDQYGSSATYLREVGTGPLTGPTRYDYFLYTTQQNNGQYWSTTAPDANGYYPGSNPSDGYANQTRQAGPYTGTSYDYQIVLERCVNGTVTQLGSYAHGLTTINALRIRANGSTVQVFINGTQRLSATDSSTGTKVGIGGGASSLSPLTPDWDDFSVTANLTAARVSGAWTWKPRKTRVNGAWTTKGVVTK